MHMVKPLLLVFLLGATGGGAFFAVRAITGQEGDVHPSIIAYEDALKADQLKPRFEGDVLGVFIAPPDNPVPEQYRGARCAGSTVLAPWGQAGQFGLSIDLPPKFEFQPEDLNTGVIACDGHVYAARWAYHFRSAGGGVGSVVIARGEGRWQPYDVAVDGVEIIATGGRPAILLEPIAPDLANTSAVVMFPEPFGMTSIQAAGLPMSELLQIAELVGNATR